MGQTHACSKSVLGGKIRSYYSFRLYARAALAWTEEKRSLAEDKTRKGNGRPQESALGHSQKIVAG